MTVYLDHWKSCFVSSQVNINGISLLGKHNPSAMETLRKAMHEEGPVPGIISLTVARRRYEDPDHFASASGSSSAGNSLNSNSSNNSIGNYQHQQQQPLPQVRCVRVQVAPYQWLLWILWSLWVALLTCPQSLSWRETASLDPVLVHFVPRHSGLEQMSPYRVPK